MADATGLMSNGFYDKLMDDCRAIGFVALAKIRYNTLRTTVLTREHIMDLVQTQYNVLVENGAYDREHEAWPDFTVDASQLDFMSAWLDARFAYLDEQINSACGTWSTDEAMEKSWVEVFPNPAKDRINVRFSETQPCDATVNLYDMTGRWVYSISSGDQAWAIPTQGLRHGIYTLITFRNGIQQVNRVVVGD